MNLSIDTEVIFDERRGKDYISANPPFYDSSTFHQDQLGGSPLYDYARSGNPNRTILEEKLAHLEKVNMVLHLHQELQLFLQFYLH